MNALERYVLDNSMPQDELMNELERVTYQRAVHPHMISGHLQGSLLRMITAMTSPRRVLEIGTFTGYSTLSIASALKRGAVIDTIEANDELLEISREFFERSPYGDKIIQHTGSALDIAPALGHKYDLVFIDGGKREYPDYYRMIMGDAADGCGASKEPPVIKDPIRPKGRKRPAHGGVIAVTDDVGNTTGPVAVGANDVASPTGITAADIARTAGNAFTTRQPLVANGCFIIADNILWYGKVADPSCRDADTRAIIEFNRMVANDPRVENIIIPIRDGLNLIRVRFDVEHLA